ncbi:MAG TPA: TRAP transporter large permease [Azospirillum sp.]|nr:TRAP transporter large permease [Azospirillum sp.]
MTILLLMGITIFIPLMLGVPIAVALGTGGIFWLVLLDVNTLKGAAFAVWNTASNDVLISVPLFIWMGEIIQRAGIATRFYNAVTLWVRWLPGGLLHANIAACALFSAVSGSSIATAATIAKSAIPNLLRLKYDKRQVFGSLAAGGTLGILIPPSIPLIIYAALVEASLGRLFLAAIVPGVMMVLIFHTYILLTTLRTPHRHCHRADDEAGQSRLRSLAEIFPLVTIIVCILGGIYYVGASTNEVAGVGVLASLLVAAVRRCLSPSMLWESLLSTARVTSLLIFVVIGAQIFSFAVFSWGVNWEVTNWIEQSSLDRVSVLLAIIAMYFVLGMFIDAISMMVLTLSIVYPIIMALNYDPVWFGIVLVLILEIGLITPPVGMNLFTIQAVDPVNITFLEVARGALPYVVLLLLGIGFLIAFPDLALWLPSRARMS